MSTLKKLQFLPEDSVYDEMDSPVGTLTIITSPRGLHAVLWDVDRYKSISHQLGNRLCLSKNDELIKTTKIQLLEYFQGVRKTFDLPLCPQGTEFQLKAWEQLLKIDYATTKSYGEQAEGIGNKNKARAVGAANGLNPISIIIPCHRVIGSNGKLVGFAGGLDKKAYLLQLERNS